MGSCVGERGSSLILENFHVQLVAENGGSLGTLYDQVCQSLEAIASWDSKDGEGVTLLTRLQLELDGSFVCGGEGWQLDGMMYDIADRLQYVDLKGSCPRTVWSSLVRIFAESPSPAAVVKLPQGGLYDLQSFEESVWL